VGTFAFTSIDSWRVPPPRGRDDAHPIGQRTTLPFDHTATLAEERNGRVVYGEEVPIGVFASEVRELPAEVKSTLGVPRLHAWLFLTDVERRQTGDALSGATVSFCALPYSQNRFATMTLRRTSHRSSSEIGRRLSEAVQAAAPSDDPEQRLQAALDALSFVPFVQRKDVVGSWMLYPTRSELLGVGRFDEERNYTVGLCREFQRCRELLAIDPHVEWLRELTRTDRLLKERPHAAQQKKGPVARRVSAIAHEQMNLTMDLAIRLALAGVVDGERLYGRSVGSDRPVALQVAPIYEDIMYEWSRRPEPIEPPPTPTQVGPPDDVLEQLARLRTQLEGIGEDATLRGYESNIGEWDPADPSYARLLLACPEPWALSAPIRAFMRRCLARLSPESIEHVLLRRRLGPSIAS